MKVKSQFTNAFNSYTITEAAKLAIQAQGVAPMPWVEDAVLEAFLEATDAEARRLYNSASARARAILEQEAAEESKDVIQYFAECISQDVFDALESMPANLVA